MARRRRAQATVRGLMNGNKRKVPNLKLQARKTGAWPAANHRGWMNDLIDRSPGKIRGWRSDDRNPSNHPNAAARRKRGARV